MNTTGGTAAWIWSYRRGRANLETSHTNHQTYSFSGRSSLVLSISETLFNLVTVTRKQEMMEKSMMKDGVTTILNQSGNWHLPVQGKL